MVWLEHMKQCPYLGESDHGDLGVREAGSRHTQVVQHVVAAQAVLHHWMVPGRGEGGGGRRRDRGGVEVVKKRKKQSEGCGCDKEIALQTL